MGTNATGIDRRSEILEQIRQCVCVDRCKTHGDAEDNFADIATLWTWWIKARYGVVIQLDALDSAEMMNLMKSTRKAKTPFHLDHWVDGGGYNVCGAGIVKKYLDEQAMKKELDGLASAKPARCCTCRENPHRKCVLNEGHAGVHEFVAHAVDHGEDELKKTDQRGMHHVPGGLATTAMFCGHAIGTFRCGLMLGHPGNHIYG